MNLLAIDYGTRRIGIAVAQTPLAEPLTIIANRVKSESEIVTPAALKEILNLVDQFKIEKIIIGISEGKTAEKTIQFCEQLRKLLEIPIEEVDETLSTYDAEELTQFQKKSKREADKDHIAAAKFLQDYLDLQPQTI